MNMDSRSSLPPLGRFSCFSTLNNSYSTKPELSASSNLPPRGAESSSNGDHKIPSHYNADSSPEISQMPGNPSKDLRHRRAHSDVYTLLNDISFESDLGFSGGLDGLSVLDENETEQLPEYLDMDNFNSTTQSFVDQMPNCGAEPGSSKLGRRLTHSQSLIVVSNATDAEMQKPDSEIPSSAEADKSISAANLAELALTDPKRAKRIWANRQSAARSKERKMRYISELQSKVQNMQSEKASLSMQFALLQGDTNSLASENIELKLQLQSLEQQVHLQDALNDALKEEIQQLKVLTGQAMPNGQPLMNNPTPYGVNQNYHSNNHAVNTQPLQYQFRQHQLDQFQPRQLLLH